MAKIMTQRGGMLQMIAAAAYAPGEIVKHASGVFGVYSAMEAPVIGQLIELDPCPGQVVEVPSASGTTFSIGVNVGFDLSTQLAVAESSGDSDGIIGRAFKAKTSGQLVVLVLFAVPLNNIANVTGLQAALDAKADE